MIRWINRGFWLFFWVLFGVAVNKWLPAIQPSLSAMGEQVLSAVSGAANAGSGVRSIPAAGEIDVGFSPDGGADEMVVSAIRAASKSVRVAAYSFTSKTIARELVAAHKRGVDVKVVLDKSQLSERYTSATFLANAGIPVHIDHEHAIQHNKYMVIDGRHVQTGSFNYTNSAASRNAENVLVLWNNPSVASVFQRDWNEHWQHSQ